MILFLSSSFLPRFGAFSFIFLDLANLHSKRLSQSPSKKLLTQLRFQTVEKAVISQAAKNKDKKLLNISKGQKPKASVEEALGLLAFSVLTLWRTLVRRRM